MIVGVPKEIKNHEYRVALLPVGAELLSKNGHQVLVQAGAGIGSGIQDKEYQACGAKIVPEAGDVFSKAEVIIKVKEPLAEEWPMMRRGQVVFTYFHFAADRKLTDGVLATGCVAIAYETILDRNGKLPSLHERGWKDTVLVEDDETVRIMMEFKDYADPHSPYMFHCHILEHEDHGMMGQFVVVDDLSIATEVRTEAQRLRIGHAN